MWVKIKSIELIRTIEIGDNLFQYTPTAIGILPLDDFKLITSGTGKLYEIIEINDRRLQLKPIPIDNTDLNATLNGIYNSQVERIELTNGNWYTQIKYKYRIIIGEADPYTENIHTLGFEDHFPEQVVSFNKKSYRVKGLGLKDAKTEIYIFDLEFEKML